MESQEKKVRLLTYEEFLVNKCDKKCKTCQSIKLSSTVDCVKCREVRENFLTLWIDYTK